MARKLVAAIHRPEILARLLLSATVLFTAGNALADRREWYTVLGYEPGLSRYETPSGGSGSATKFASAVSLGAYYGLTDTLHVGARIRATTNANIDIGKAVVPLPDGSRPSGDLYLDHQSLGLGALLLYRFDTKHSLAPLVELEGGVTAHRFQRIAFFPAGAAHSYPQGSVSKSALYGSAALLLEYRFLNRWVAAAGVSVHGEGGGLMPFGIYVPLRFGIIW